MFTKNKKKKRKKRKRNIETFYYSYYYFSFILLSLLGREQNNINFRLVILREYLERSLIISREGKKKMKNEKGMMGFVTILSRKIFTILIQDV